MLTEEQQNAIALERAKRCGFKYDPAPCLKNCGSEGSRVCNEYDSYCSAYANARRSDSCEAYKAWRKKYLGLGK